MQDHLPYFESAQLKSKAVFVGRRVHGKRVTCLEWRGGYVISGDKNGAVRVWDVRDAFAGEVFEMGNVGNAAVSFAHNCNINAMAFKKGCDNIMYTSSSDGRVCQLDLALMPGKMGEDAIQGREVVQNLNPDGYKTPSTFKMACGLAYDSRRDCVYVGISDGHIRRFDPRSKTPDVVARFHKGKVTTVDLNPMNTHLIATASNDTRVCLWDARKFVPGAEIGSYTHGRVVSSAFFSPNTGAKLLTTSLDNRLQVWDCVHKFCGDVNTYPDAKPLSLVHSHDFHRHLSPFRAAWDPKDWRDDLFVCGRFLGDAYRDENGEEEVLHPVDIFSVKAGGVVGELVDSAVTLICTINRFSPNGDAVVTGASGDLIVWSGTKKGAGEEMGAGGAGTGNARRGDDDDDDDGDDGDEPAPRKKRKLVVRGVRTRRTGRQKASS